MNYIAIYLKGMLMGMADLVPGVSGGTMALITGIYERLIQAIAAVNWANFKLLLAGNISQAWKQVDGWFLVAVFAGILTAIFSFASVFKYLLLNHPVLTWSFFFGLIISSAVMLLLKHRSKQLRSWLLLLVGLVAGYVVSTQPLGALPAGNLGVFIAGTVAICAMILPGISGSLILILLGQYAVILAAVENREFTTLAVFAGGCVVGLMAFSRLLKWLLARYHDATLYFLAGLMLGTLFKVWPWKSAIGNVLPSTHPEPHTLSAFLLMVLATGLVWLLFRIDQSEKHP